MSKWPPPKPLTAAFEFTLHHSRVAEAARKAAEADRKAREPETIPCKWCERNTRMLGTKMWDGCWELEHRISADPDLARRMLDDLDAAE